MGSEYSTNVTLLHSSFFIYLMENLPVTTSKESWYNYFKLIPPTVTKENAFLNFRTSPSKPVIKYLYLYQAHNHLPECLWEVSFGTVNLQMLPNKQMMLPSKMNITLSFFISILCGFPWTENAWKLLVKKYTSY